MVGERLNYEISATDSTQAGVQSARQNLSGIGDELETASERGGTAFGNMFARIAGAAATTFGLIFQELSNQIDSAQTRIQALRISTGLEGPEIENELARLLRGGFSQDEAVGAIAAATGGSADLLGLPTAEGDFTSPGAQYAVDQLVGLERLGVDSSVAVQGAAGFGLDAVDFGPSAEIVALRATGSDIGTPELFADIRNYGPVLAQLGLSYLEATEFLADLRVSGITPSRVLPAVNQFVRRQSRDGIPPRAAAQQFFENFRNLGPQEALARTEELFGAEGATRFSQLLNQGAIGLSEEALAIDLGDVGSLESLARPTTAQLTEGALAATEVDPDSSLAQRVAAGLVGGGSSIPLVGSFVESLTRRGTEQAGYGQAASEDIGPIVVALLAEQLVATQQTVEQNERIITELGINNTTSSNDTGPSSRGSTLGSELFEDENRATREGGG